MHLKRRGILIHMIVRELRNTKVALFALFFFFFHFSGVSAAEMYFSTSEKQLYKDDIFVVEARISNPDELINVIDGSFLFNSAVLEVRELSTGGSVLNLWAQGPEFSNKEGSISFVGGVPQGFQGNNGLIARIIFKAAHVGVSQLDFGRNFSLLLSDGRGTKITPQTRPLALSVLERPAEIAPRDEWQELVAIDRIPPEFIEAIITKDPTVFDSSYFVSFFAADNDSGISHYEIQEGERSFVRAESPYVLRDQLRTAAVRIKAIDKAGNEQGITLAPEPVVAEALWYRTTLLWGITVVLLAAFVLFRRKIKF